MPKVWASYIFGQFCQILRAIQIFCLFYAQKIRGQFVNHQQRFNVFCNVMGKIASKLTFLCSFAIYQQYFFFSFPSLVKILSKLQFCQALTRLQLVCSRTHQNFGLATCFGQLCHTSKVPKFFRQC